MYQKHKILFSEVKCIKLFLTIIRRHRCKLKDLKLIDNVYCEISNDFVEFPYLM